MRTAALAAFTAVLLSTSALAATPDEILAANRAATGGDAWNKPAVALQFDYAGNGLTGKAYSITDLKTGAFEQHYIIGPQAGANGYDGTHVWNKDNSGIVTLQEAADAVPLAVNNAYRNANLWWKPDHGGARITGGGQKTDNGNTYDVLTVVPRGGQSFDAWFDARTHLLYRTDELQGGVMTKVTTTDYKDFNGTQQPLHVTINQGEAKYDQHMSLTNVTFLKTSDPASYAPPKSAAADFSIAGGAHSVTFPFQLINNHIHANVMVNGKGPYMFIFDTGGVNLITPELAKELGITIEGKAAARGAGDAVMESGLARVGEINVGGAIIKDQVFVSIPLDTLYPSNGLHMPGMVGYETFRRFITRIDYGAHTVTLTDPKFFDPKDAGTPVHIAFNGNAAIVDGTYEGVPGKFQIDTGARSSLTLNAPYVAANHFPSGKSVDTIDGWGIGGPSRSHLTRGGALAIGGVTASAHPVVGMSVDKGGAFADPSLSGNIGGGILKRFVVTFDYGHNTMYLKPAAGPIADLDTYDRAGMWFNVEPEGYKIIAVTPGGPAEAAGLKADDVITSIDGKAVADLVLPTVRQRLRTDAAGTSVKLHLASGTDVTVTLKDQI